MLIGFFWDSQSRGFLCSVRAAKPVLTYALYRNVAPFIGFKSRMYFNGCWRLSRTNLRCKFSLKPRNFFYLFAYSNYWCTGKGVFSRTFFEFCYSLFTAFMIKQNEKKNETKFRNESLDRKKSLQTKLSFFFLISWDQKQHHNVDGCQTVEIKNFVPRHRKF